MNSPRPKNCSQCGKPASLHLTKVVDGKLHKLAICADCPHGASIKGSVGFDLIEAGSPAKVSRTAESESTVACPHCGLTPADFKESGRLGCPSCYETYAAKLEPILSKLHRGPSHLGKAPRGRKREISQEEIAALKNRLQEYVAREEYEMAAQVRDQLRSLGG